MVAFPRRLALASFLAAYVIAAAAADIPYVGCFKTTKSTIGYQPLELNIANFQKIPSSLQTCKRWCDDPRNSFNTTLYAVSDTSCYCGTWIGSGVQQVADSGCSTPCKEDGSKYTCGGPGGFSVYGSASDAVPPGYLNGLSYGGCYSADKVTFDGPTYTDSNAMTVNSCASFCVGKHGMRNIFLKEKDKCFCVAEQPQLGSRAWDGVCNGGCPGDIRQKCGGTDPTRHDREDRYMSYWKLEG